MKKGTARVILGCIVVLPALAVALWGDRLLDGRPSPAVRRADGAAATLRAVFFDVGQGDSFLLRDAEGNDVLVDGGPTDAVVGKLGETLPPTDRTIELVVLTHPHADHVDGLVEVLRRYAVGRVLMTGVAHGSAAYRAFQDEIARQGIPVTVVATSTAVDVGRIRLDALWPGESLEGRGPPKDNLATGGGVNDTSIVLRATYGSSTLLLMGDASSATEEALLAAGALGDVDVLKVGHHGSKYSTSRGFLAAVRPEIAVIQVGAKNRYGHPTLQTLLRLAEAGARVLRTDEDGDVTVETDGRTMTVRTSR